MQLTRTEQEVVTLLAAVESLDELLNRVMLILHETPGGTQVQFPTAVHQRLFSALLVDLLEKASSALTGAPGSLLDALKEVTDSPSFDQEGSSEYISVPLRKLAEWLATSIEVTVHLQTLGIETTLRLTRHEFIYICGNMSKHNFTRLTVVAKRMSDLLIRHDIAIDPVNAILVLDDFFDRFHGDVLNYLSTVLAALLNDLRWGIHDYLWLQYLESHKPEAPPSTGYSYRYPAGVESEFAKTCFWDLMNRTRGNPYLPLFRPLDLLKLRY